MCTDSKKITYSYAGMAAQPRWTPQFQAFTSAPRRKVLVKKKIEAMAAGLNTAVFPRYPAPPGSRERKEAAKKALMSLKDVTVTVTSKSATSLPSFPALPSPGPS